MRIFCKDQVSSTAVIEELLPEIMKGFKQHFWHPRLVVKISNNDQENVRCVPADESSVRIHLSYYKVNEGFIFIYLSEMAAKLRERAKLREQKGADGLLPFPKSDLLDTRKRALNKRTSSQAEEGGYSTDELDSAVKNLNQAFANASAAEVRIGVLEDKAAVTISLKHTLMLHLNEACFSAFQQFANSKTNDEVTKLLLIWKKVVSEYNHEYEILILEGQKIRNLAIYVSELALHMHAMVKKVEEILTEAQFMDLCDSIDDNVKRLLSRDRSDLLASPTSAMDILDVDDEACAMRIAKSR